MSGLDLNLARAPFANRRPVRRAATVLWALAALLVVVNGSLYWRHFSGSEGQKDELEMLRARTATETTQRDEALAALEGFDLDWQREQILFLNDRIAERVFAWSALFDHLAEVLPPTVRLTRVSPKVSLQEAGAQPAANVRTKRDEVSIKLTGVSEQDEVLLEFVDGFYRHPRFRRPDLQIESRSESESHVQFSMSVIYTPEEVRPPKRARRAAARVDGGADADEASVPDAMPEEASPTEAVAEVES